MYPAYYSLSNSEAAAIVCRCTQQGACSGTRNDTLCFLPLAALSDTLLLRKLGPTTQIVFLQSLLSSSTSHEMHARRFGQMFNRLLCAIEKCYTNATAHKRRKKV